MNTYHSTLSSHTRIAFSPGAMVSSPSSVSIPSPISAPANITSSSNSNRKRQLKGQFLPLVSISTQTDLQMPAAAVSPIIKTPQLPARSIAPLYEKLPHMLVRSCSSNHISSSSSVAVSSPPSTLRDLTASFEGLEMDGHCNHIGKSYSAPSSPMEGTLNAVNNSSSNHVNEKGNGDENSGYESDDEHSCGRGENHQGNGYLEGGDNSSDIKEAYIKSSEGGEQRNEADQPKGLPAACLFVASLSSSRTDEQLQESVTKHFEQWGSLLHVKVLKDAMSRPYAFVQYENPEDASKALTLAKDTNVDNRRIRVEQARVNRTLYVARFARTITETSVEAHERQLEEIFTKYGPVEELTVLVNTAGHSRNEAYVKFAYRDDAIRAFIGIRRSFKWVCEWCDTNLNLNVPGEYPEVPRYESQNFIEHNSIFVGNLNPSKVTYQSLEQRFGEYGIITALRLMDTVKNGNGSSKPAFAFVTYKDEESAYKAVEDANGKTWLDKPLRVQTRQPPNMQHRTTTAQPTYAMIAGHYPSGMVPPHIGSTTASLPAVRYTSAPPQSMMQLAPPTPMFMPPTYPIFPPPFTPQMNLHRNSVSSNGSTEGTVSEASSLGTNGGNPTNPNAAEFVPVTPPMSPMRMRILSADSGPLFGTMSDYDEPAVMESPMIPFPNMMQLHPNFNQCGLPTTFQSLQQFGPPPQQMLSTPMPPVATNDNQFLHQRQTSSGSTIMTPQTPALFLGGVENMPPSPMTTPAALPYIYPFGLPPGGLSFIPPPPQPIIPPNNIVAPSPQLNARPVGQQPMFADSLGSNGGRQRMRSGGYGGLRSPTSGNFRPYPIHPNSGTPGAIVNNIGNGGGMVDGDGKQPW